MSVVSISTSEMELARARQALDAACAARFESIGRISDAFTDVPIDELLQRVERALADVRSRAGGTANRGRRMIRSVLDANAYSGVVSFL